MFYPVMLTSKIIVKVWGEIINNIIGKWSESINDKDRRVGLANTRVVCSKDSLNEWVLDRGNIFYIINVLCVKESTCICVYTTESFQCFSYK